MQAVVNMQYKTHWSAAPKEPHLYIIQRCGRAAGAFQRSGFCKKRPADASFGFSRATAKAGFTVCALLTALTVTVTSDARAALGGRSDPRSAYAPMAVAPADRGGFLTRSSATAEGGSFTEFSDSSGLVFAVTWKSPVMPELQALLGTWAPAFTVAQQRQMQARRDGPGAPLLSLRSMSVHEGDLVAFSAGRQQAYWGYAYLRSAVPAGFDAGQLAH
jgi:hypothetical protein